MKANVEYFNLEFFKKKRIFITGHTGFKGSWLSLWLASLGSEITGYSLAPPEGMSLFKLANVETLLKKSIFADILDVDSLTKAVKVVKPEIIIHMAAQPLVRESYESPVKTYATNVMGTVNILDAARSIENLKVVLNITTDKVYENQEWEWPYRENEPLGGYDPYSSSKACSELVTLSYRKSFFQVKHGNQQGVSVATARAGNVIGGGDFATDRLIPDIVRSTIQGKTIQVRNPDSIRPWQHVLDPLYGYMMLIHKLYVDGDSFSESWNFGPYDKESKTVFEIISKFEQICKSKNLKGPKVVVKSNEKEPHEAKTLKLDISKSVSRLGWKPRWSTDDALEKIVDWMKAYNEKENIREICLKQIEEYRKFENSYDK
ncbi:CDP-glucose 4,6-dehydratase [Leptospira noguchii]|uniref:CDP-glucose 4,6-dehydratase n=1 Tax=Leptospira noguchii serovar Panama str. CZ214 TaxID=1001595 RepID=T0FI69_9LEPT|nr:CDP-glucose 4,6-dehydratase [Leptospira noguchii]EQA69709.1 CDP-glucose 4,6-dehydratase [Leptospira noguchii serovar Panama str. CZ214]